MGKYENQRKPIGVFDSGVGGLTVLKEIMDQLPGEDIIYFGDTARVPYGGKAKQTIQRYSEQIAHFLLSQDVKAIVVACNTASALALEHIQEKFSVPIIGVVIPGASAALEATKNGHIGIIGTKATIKSEIYPKLIKLQDDNMKVYGKACPLFVPLVEEGWQQDEITKEIASRYLIDLQDKEIDTLILGCTHYPLLMKAIGEVMGDEVTLVNPAYETAKELFRLLSKQDLLNPKSSGQYHFFVSDEDSIFEEFSKRILKVNVNPPTKINIEEY